jgi:hypothetical protein
MARSVTSALDIIPLNFTNDLVQLGGRSDILFPRNTPGTDLTAEFAALTKTLYTDIDDFAKQIKVANRYLSESEIYTAMKNSGKFTEGSLGARYLDEAIKRSKPAENVAPDAVKATENLATMRKLFDDAMTNSETTFKNIGKASKADKDAAIKDLERAKSLTDDPGAKNAYDKLIEMVNRGDEGLKFIPDWVRNNPGTSFVIAGGTVTGLTFLGLALDRYLKSKDNPRTITKVERDGFGSKKLRISYTPNIKILKQDSITIRGSMTTPSIDGSPSIVSSPNDSSVIVEVSESMKTLAPGGTIDVTPNFTASLGKEVGAPLGAVANAAGQVAGEGLGAAGSGIGEFFSGLFGDGTGTMSMLVLAVIVVLMVIK